jgi:hypothetical protein
MRNKTSVFTILGASNHSLGVRHKEDFYATEPRAVNMLLDKEQFSKNIWECACGNGHISKELIKKNYSVRSSDLVKRNYECEEKDFLCITNNSSWNGDIITNPPYKFCTEFVYKAMSIIDNGNKVAMFLSIMFLESKTRKELFKIYPPKVIYVASSRLNCAKGGDFEKFQSSARCYAWFVWEKGFQGDPIIKWIN